MLKLAAGTIGGKYLPLSLGKRSTDKELTSNYAWPGYQHGRARTGFSSNTIGPSGPITTQWSKGFNHQWQSAPIIGPDNVYVQTTDINSESTVLYAFDLADGTSKWSFRSEEFSDHHPFLTDGLVYLVNGSNLTALDIKTGSKQWQKSLGYFPESGPVVGDEGVYVGRGADITSYNKKNGAKKWQNRDIGLSKTPLSVGNKSIYVVDRFDGFLYSVSEETGNLQWSIDAKGSRRLGPPIVQGSHVYITDNSRSSEGANLRAIDAKTGAIAWSTGFRPYLHPVVAASESTVYVMARQTGKSALSS